MPLNCQLAKESESSAYQHHKGSLRQPGHPIAKKQPRPGLIILPADKGCATVVLDKKVYDTKLWEMLSDQQTYKKIKKEGKLPPFFASFCFE